MELDRDVTDDERKLMAELLIRLRKEPYDSVRVIPAGNQAGLHEERTRQIVRTWTNDGLVKSNKSGANLVALTDYGERLAEDLAGRYY